MKKFALAAFTMFLICSAAARAGEPMRSVVVGEFPQRWPTKFTPAETLAGEDVRSIIISLSTVFIGTDNGVSFFEGGKWVKLMKSVSDEGLFNKYAKAVVSGGDSVIVDAPRGIFVISSALFSKVTLKMGTPPQVTSFGNSKTRYFVGTEEGLYSAAHDGGEPECVPELCGVEIRSIEQTVEGVWAATADGLYFVDENNKPEKFPAGWGGPISDNVRALCLDENGILWAGTDKGIARYDTKTKKWTNITGAEGGLPYEDILAVAARDGVLWVGTSIGAARRDGAEWHYFQGERYLPDDRVQAVAIAPDGSAWLGTPKGVSRIEYRPWTLEEKAEYILKGLRERHVRHGQTASSHLAVPGDLSSNVMFSSDNDGLWTGMYIASECYHYAETGNPEAKKNARQGIELMMRLMDITGVPGFIARSIALRDEDVGQGGEWDHFTPDGRWKWKGDTSSDEVDGHFFAYSVYYDLCADTEEEKAEIRPYPHALMSHIIDHDYFLVDTDGKHTSWGLWNPGYLNGPGFFQRNLNALEVLSYLKTAYHITGDERFQEEYLKIAIKEKFAKYAVKQKLSHLNIINHSDDELAFLAYYPLLKYEKDPRLREYYVKSVERSWQIERPERSSLFNFIYGSAVDGGLDLEESVWTLKRIPPDTIRWSVRNSQRADIEIDEERDRFGKTESVVPLPPDERAVMKWNGNPYALDGGWEGRSEDDGTVYLLPYWMGRYYDFIVEERETEK
ncbi:MAG: two-component regulator propeller domain-containing protein [bacterium]